jgi:hypothetical protein
MDDLTLSYEDEKVAALSFSSFPSKVSSSHRLPASLSVAQVYSGLVPADKPVPCDAQFYFELEVRIHVSFTPTTADAVCRSSTKAPKSTIFILLSHFLSLNLCDHGTVPRQCNAVQQDRGVGLRGGCEHKGSHDARYAAHSRTCRERERECVCVCLFGMLL